MQLDTVIRSSRLRGREARQAYSSIRGPIHLTRSQHDKKTLDVGRVKGLFKGCQEFMMVVKPFSIIVLWCLSLRQGMFSGVKAFFKGFSFENL